MTTPTTTTFEYTGAIQTYDVATNGIYKIEATGAPGGTMYGSEQMYQGNGGVSVTATFNLLAGSDLGVVVGGAGSIGGFGGNGMFGGFSGGGGGGSFVYQTSTSNLPTLLAVGGGGGGAGLNEYSSNPFPGVYGATPFVAPATNQWLAVVDTSYWYPILNPDFDSRAPYTWIIPATGGTGLGPGEAGRGFHGGAASPMPYQGAGGGGWWTAGADSATSPSGTNATPSSGGGGILEGFSGGTSGTNGYFSWLGGNGGFGGGGAGENLGGGGGGGYTGGGGGGSYGYGGNGGSFVASSALSESAEQSFIDFGNGSVNVTLIRADLGSGSMVAYDTAAGENAGVIARVYEAALNRAPDEAGMGFWLSKLDAGASLNNVASQIMASGEFQNLSLELYGNNPSNEQFITSIYIGILDRTPDAAGEAFWLQQLNNDMSRVDVLISISESAEAVSYTSQTLMADGVPYQQWVG